MLFLPPHLVERHYRCVILGTAVISLPFVFAYDFVSGSLGSCFPSYMALNNPYRKPGNKSKPQIVM